MKMVLLGLIGAGKGTQAKLVAERRGLLHVSTGDMLREAVAQGTALGTQANDYMSRGELVPDELVIGMLLERINQPDAAGGFILDGFPRTVAQAEALQTALEAESQGIDIVPFIRVPEAMLLERIARVAWTTRRRSRSAACASRRRASRASPASTTGAARSAMSTAWAAWTRCSSGWMRNWSGYPLEGAPDPAGTGPGGEGVT